MAARSSVKGIGLPPTFSIHQPSFSRTPSSLKSFVLWRHLRDHYMSLEGYIIDKLSIILILAFFRSVFWVFCESIWSRKVILFSSSKKSFAFIFIVFSVIRRFWMKNHRCREKIIKYLLSVLKNISVVVAEMSQQRQFVICEKFLNKNEQSTAKWLKKLKWELTAQKINDKISFKILLKSIDLLIIEKASNWTETDSEIVHFLILNRFIVDETKRLRTLLCERFFAKIQEFTIINFDEKMMNLKQKKNETLMSYYKRITFIMFQMKAKNRDIIVFTQTEFTFLNTTIRIFVRKINDRYVQIEAFRHLIESDRSLRNIYAAIEKANRNKNVIRKLIDEKFKIKKLKYLRSYALKIMIKIQLNFNLTFLSSNSHLIFSNHNFLEYSYQENNIRFASNSNHNQNYENNTYKFFQRRNSFEEFNQYNNSVNRKSFESANENSVFQFKNDNFKDNYARDISKTKTSKNSYINDTRTWNFQLDKSICVRCEEIEFRFDETHNCVHLSIWEQFYLKQIVYDISAQINYASIEYNEFDENVHSYDIFMRFSMQSSSMFFSSDVQIMTLFSFRDSFSANFIICEINEFFVRSKDNVFDIVSDVLSSVNSKSVQVFYDEKSAINKRSHIENTTQQNQKKYQFQSQTNRLKKKEMKKIKKRSKLISLIEMFDDSTNTYDKFISRRKLLKNNRIDINMMNLLIWSSSMQKKFKRLIIRIAKNKVFKRKIIEVSIFVNSFVSFFFTQSIQFSTNVFVFTESAFFFSEKSVQFYNFFYSSFSFAFEIVSKQFAFAQFQNQFFSISQFIRNQQNAITIEQASSQMYSQLNTQAMNVNS